MEIQGHNKYLIYPDGRVFSKHKNSKKFLKHGLSTHGYKTVNLDGKNISLHRLLGIHYIPNPENKSCIDHKDRNKLNNNLDNLRWVSHIENMNNLGLRNTNTSGITNISFDKKRNKWVFEKNIMGKKIFKRFDCKNNALWFKFINILIKTDKI